LFDDIRVLHLESTSICNAACPQCARFLRDGKTLDPRIIQKDLTLETIKEKLPVDFVRQLDKMFMCGNFGDPAAAKDTLEIFRWFRDVNPNITLGMNTNGSLKTTKFWQELGEILNRQTDYCVFSIDGLEDTNHIYRRNTVWSKIVENVTAFISAGGRAHWDMLIFNHNQHQVTQAQQLAKELGFSIFRSKVSKRFLTKPIAGLEPPATQFEQIISKDIDCYALKESSMYMDYEGNFWPCCWLASKHLHEAKVTKIENFSDIESVYHTTPFETCTRTCGKKDDKTNFTNQWTTEINFR